MSRLRRALVPAALLLSLLPPGIAAAGRNPQLTGDACSVMFYPNGGVLVEFAPIEGEQWFAYAYPSHSRDRTARIVLGDGTATAYLRAGRHRAQLRVSLLPDGCRLEVSGDAAQGPTLAGGIGSRRDSPRRNYSARIALDADRNPTPLGGGDVLDIATGQASSRRANAVYSADSFRGLLLEPGDATPKLAYSVSGVHTFACESQSLTIRALDVWPLIGWRPASAACTFDHPESNQPHTIPRGWMEQHRPFPWKRLSPVQLPFISIADPADFPRVKEQVDWLADNLRDWGFNTFGEWPLTQHNPEYDPVRKQAYLEGNKRTCDYAHSKGIKILRWVTDPDIEPHYYPQLYEEFKRKGWFADEPKGGEWLLDYTNPEVQKWVEQHYADLAATGPDFYWIDNNRPTKPKVQPDLFPPDAFRGFYLSIQRGLLSTGRNDILMRSGASMWADYTAAGILDVYAPGPDVQNDWTEQQLYVAGELARNDYLCHFNLWRRCIDDYFPAGPQTIDQTRAMATLLGLTGLSFTTTDIGLPNIPQSRLDDLRKVVPIAECRPMDLYRFTNGPLPRWWVLNQQQGDHAFQVAGVFNWGLKTEEVHYKSFEDLGLDPSREYLVYDFWSQDVVDRFRGGIGLRVAPTTGRALAIHPVEDYPFIVATDRHVTMGAAELADVKWDAKKQELTGRFVAGVKGETFTLTVYSPPGLKPEGGEYPGEGLWEVALPCDGPEVPIRIAFHGRAEASAPPTPITTSEGAEAALRSDDPVWTRRLAVTRLDRLHFLDDAALCRRLSAPEEAARLLVRARAGEHVMLVSPSQWSPDLARLQDGIGLRWGLLCAGGTGVALVTGEGGTEELPEGLLLRSTCLAFCTNFSLALLKPVGKGYIAVLPPLYGGQEADEMFSRAWLSVAWLFGAPHHQAAAKSARREWRKCVRDATSTVGPFRVNGAHTEGTAALNLAHQLGDLRPRLSFHFKRLSHSLITSEWAVPRISIFVNGVECPHNYNPCRPESPPQEWDSLYFTIPRGAPGPDMEVHGAALRYDGTDQVTIRSTVPATSAEAFAADLRDGLELCIEDTQSIWPGALGDTPAVAVTAPPGLDAFLGLDGGIRFTNRSDADLIPHGGAPHNGWPVVRPKGVSHCWFDTEGFTLEVRVPEGSAGTLEVFAYDYEQVRTEELSFEGAAPVTLTDFGNGKWLSFPFTAEQSADGKLMLETGNPRGGNCVLSRVKLSFAQ